MNRFAAGLAVVALAVSPPPRVTPTVHAAPSHAAADSTLPFGVGEQLMYDVRFGPLRVGEGSMEVLEMESVRGRDAWHTRFRVRGGIPFYRVDDVLESWIDSEAFNSLRFVQDYDEGGRTRERRYEIYPERSVFQEGDKAEEESIPNPLDDGAFLYFVRTVALEVGKTYEFHRYYRPDRNPVIVKVLKPERITVPAGTFDALVIQPVIKTKGIFSEKGEAQIWLSDDDRRIMLQLKSKTKVGSLSLFLKSYRPPRSTNP